MDIAILPRRACPTITEPMRTGDGFLARLPPLTAPLTPHQLAGIAAAAQRHGNGLVEITRRGNLQLRGLAEHGGPALAADLAAQGLHLPTGAPISADALLAPAEAAAAGALAAAIHARLDATGLASRLAPKTSIVLDLGSPFAPDRLAADLRVAIRTGRAHLALGGRAADARPVGSVETGLAVDAIAALLETLATFGRFARLAGPDGVRDDKRFDAALAAVGGAGPALAVPPPGAGAPSPVAAIAFAFGQCDAAALGELAEKAAALGIAAISPAPDRRLLLAGEAGAVDAIAADAAALGFVTGAGDPRLSIFACAGSAGCAAGALPTRQIAGEIATAAQALLDGSFALHLSGCAKGCAHPEPAALAFTAIDKGLALVLEGRPRDEAAGIVPAAAIAGRLARLAEAAGRGDGSAADGLRRLGGARIAALLCSDDREDDCGRDGSRGRRSRLSA